MAPSADKYDKVVQYAVSHAKAPFDRLVVQSICAGIWVGLSGHAAVAAATSVYTSKASLPAAKAILSCLFPVAILGIYFTGAELYTGNTMAMMFNFLHRKSRAALTDMVRVFAVNTLGNLVGCLLVVFVISSLTGTFHPQNDSANPFIDVVCAKKVSYKDFWTPFLLAIGANFFVCSAVFAAVIIEETVGKMLALWFFVAVFLFGGLEHIVANFYMTSLCFSIPPYSKKYTFLKVLTTNWVPVWIGNTVAGCFLTGAVWWYVLRPRNDKQLPMYGATTTATDVKARH